MRLRAPACINVCVSACVRACECVFLCEGAMLSCPFQISLPQSSAERREPGGRESDGEIMGIEGERRLTQSLMSFHGSLCLFLGQGPWVWVD